ncbi:MAG: hypothetical protein COB04_11770 [Gammaproteobacteria bacterium]|nr:MAG: hypothetical protein COB04_11770 [Gammaproteobacteria bacterium]
MKQAAFEARYRSNWLAFEKHLDRVLSRSAGRFAKASKLKSTDTDTDTDTDPQDGEGPVDFSFSEAYRQVCNHYALAQQRGYSVSLLDYLNDLSLRGHSALYQSKTNFRYQLIRFVLFGLPQAVRKEWKLVLCASLLFYVPMVAVAVGIVLSPELAYSIFSPDQVSSFEAMYDPAADHIGRERKSETDVAMFGYYIRNNIGIGFQTVVTGIIGGLGTLFYLIYNGLAIGGVAGHLIQLGYYQPFFGFVSGHSSFELTGIVIAGAAGLKIGFSLLFPGRLRRINALTTAVAESVVLIYGVIFLLLIAAFVEAFWSSNGSVDFSVKVAVGLGTWCLVLSYFLLVGRVREA